MLFLFIDQYNYNQPPLSLRGATCKARYSIDTFWILGAVLFSGKGGESDEMSNLWEEGGEGY